MRAELSDNTSKNNITLIKKHKNTIPIKKIKINNNNIINCS